MRTILTIGGDTWTDVSSSPNDTQVWKITDKGYKEVEEGLKPTMLDDEDIIDLVDFGDDQISSLFQTSTLDEHMQSTNDEEASSE
jgi:hypothetical protein|tara:strand:+ start:341 stop:595 length:255 start_codon:yes stop_codon:yes gene_type:complete